MLEHMKKAYLLLLSFLILGSCKKNEIVSPALGTVNIVNAIMDGGAVKVNYFGRSIDWNNYVGRTSAVDYGVAQVYSFTPGNRIKIVQSGDTSKVFFDDIIGSKDRDIYSLYLGGTVSAPISISVKEDFPAFYNEMAIGIRVINLSPNSNPINITLSSSPAVNQFTGITYRMITEINKIPYPSVFVVGSNEFQLRNMSGDLLGVCVLPDQGLLSVSTARHKILTLVIKGLQGTTSGPNAFSAFFVANF